MTDNETTVEAVAKAAYIAMHLDKDWAERAWTEMTAPDDWHYTALELTDAIRAALAAIPEPATVGGVTREQVYSLAESYAYDRWPDQTVQDDQELITEVGISLMREWLTKAGLTVAGGGLGDE